MSSQFSHVEIKSWLVGYCIGILIKTELLICSPISCRQISRSNRPEVFLEKGVLEICGKFTGEHPSRSVISINLLCNFVEITLRRGCSPVNLLQIFRTPFTKNTSGRLLLDKFFLNCIYCTNLGIAEPCTVVFMHSLRKQFILQFVFTLLQVYQVRHMFRQMLFINRIFLDTFQVNI